MKKIVAIVILIVATCAFSQVEAQYDGRAKAPTRILIKIAKYKRGEVRNYYKIYTFKKNKATKRNHGVIARTKKRKCSVY
jgi:hypothetical protein